jgi:hypothetical protein
MGPVRDGTGDAVMYASFWGDGPRTRPISSAAAVFIDRSRPGQALRASVLEG